MVDTRPPVSPMPNAAAAIGQQLVDQLKPMLDQAFVQVAALPGDPAERENDAISVIANVASFVGLQVAARLMMLKQIDLALAITVALRDIDERMSAHVADHFGWDVE